MLSTVLYYELAMKVLIPVGITVYLLTWGLGHLRCLVMCTLTVFSLQYSPGCSLPKLKGNTILKEIRTNNFILLGYFLMG